MTKLSTNDQKLIAHLRKNARMSLTDISKKTGIPISTLFDRLKTHQGTTITKHTSLLNFSALGYNSRVMVFLKCARENREQVRAHLTQIPHINSLYRINSGFDFLIEAVFPHIKDAEDFIEDLEHKFSIEKKQTCYLIDEIKREVFLEGNHEMGNF